MGEDIYIEIGVRPYKRGFPIRITYVWEFVMQTTG